MLLYWILLPIIWVLAHILFRFEVIGRENLKAVRDGRAYVIAPNHIANLDPVLIAITIFDWKRLRILAKEELFKNPLAGWFLRCMGAVSIERGKGDTTTVEKLTNECKNGTGIMIFPEGTRTKTGKLGVIKSGAFVIAAAAGADMLPVRIIYGTKDGRLHLFCKVRIVFGEPIPAADLQIRDQSHKMAELRRMKNRLRDELEQLLADNAFAVRLAETAAEEPAAPDDKPQLPECHSPWPPLGGGSARRRWGRELCRGPKLRIKTRLSPSGPAGPLLPFWRKRHLPRFGGVCLAEGGKEFTKGAYLWRSSVPKPPASASVWTARSS